MTTYVQGRIHAPSPDEAAMAVRDKHPSYRGSLYIKEPWPGWYEYLLTEEEEHESTSINAGYEPRGLAVATAAGYRRQ